MISTETGLRLVVGALIVAAVLSLFAITDTISAESSGRRNGSDQFDEIRSYIVVDGETTLNSRSMNSPKPASNIEPEVGAADAGVGVRPHVPTENVTNKIKIAPGSELLITRTADGLAIAGGTLYHDGGLLIGTGSNELSLNSLAITGEVFAEPGSLFLTEADASEGRGLLISGSKISLDETNGVLVIASETTPTGGPAVSIRVSARVRREDEADRLSDGVHDAASSRSPTKLTRNAVGAAEQTAGVIGPDIVVHSLQSVDSYGSEFPVSAPEGIASFAVGTTSCNIGDEPADWYEETPAHPVISQSMFRLKNGQFEQIGLSWVKHGFFAVNQGACGMCQNPFSPAPNEGYLLGVNCSDPYSTGLNGGQSNMGPRSQISPFTGVFPYPPPVPALQGNKIERRLQVHHEDLNPVLNPGAVYFVEGHYVSADDAQAGNGANNVSYRRVILVNPDENPGACPRHKPNAIPPQIPNTVHYCVTTSTGSTQRQQAAIRAWKDTEPSVEEVEISIPEDPATVLTSTAILAAKVTDLGNGFWHYEYAIQNIDSDRAIGAFRVPIPLNAAVQNVGFHDVSYHSGNLVVENYDGTDWESAVDATEIRWATIPFAVKQNANALRWGTLYNFRFDVNAPPQPVNVTIGLFKPKPPHPNELTAVVLGPSDSLIDCNENGISDSCDVTCGPGCGENCGQSTDCDFNQVPDECEPDCNENGIADLCDIVFGPSDDCDTNEVPDECDPDCDGDNIPTACELVLDTDQDGVDDCADLCPETSPFMGCLCPEFDRCCFPTLFCIPNPPGFPREDCIAKGGTPGCLSSPCRNGCLIGDVDGDGDRDMVDWAEFQTCFSSFLGSPAFIEPSVECKLWFDYENDGDVDLIDYDQWFGSLPQTGGP